jgi:RHH-type rel operon transcriptional repressor/antitoxin RelB
MTVSVNRPPDLEARLELLASKSGQSADAQLRQIIDQGIEELEDYYAAKEILGRIDRGEEKALSAEDFWRGLDN